MIPINTTRHRCLETPLNDTEHSAIVRVAKSMGMAKAVFARHAMNLVIAEHDTADDAYKESRRHPGAPFASRASAGAPMPPPAHARSAPRRGGSSRRVLRV
jgi:hypothetical protein